MYKERIHIIVYAVEWIDNVKLTLYDALDKNIN